MTDSKSPSLAVQVNIATALGDGRQAQFSTYFAQDDDPAQVNALLDRLHDYADRQKAKYDIVGLKLELKKHESTLAQFLEDLDAVETRHKHAQASRFVEIDELNKGIASIIGNANATHVATGRHGDYSLKGSVKTNVDRHNQAVDNLRREVEKADAERSQAVQNLQKSIGRYNEVIAALKADIAHNEAIIG